MFSNYLNKMLFGLGLTLWLGAASAVEECAVRVGEYSGRVKAEWLTKSREMKLLEDFAFKGPDCRVWPVPKGAVIDGASIPRVLWGVVGGPFDGPYRDASVVHDYYCKVRTAPSEQVHDMFYHALLANGVDTNTASLMFYAVSWFGPRWQILKGVGMTRDYESFAVVRNMKDLQLSEHVVRQMSGTAGQPSPADVRLLSTSVFEARAAGLATGGKWLLKDGVAAEKVEEIGTAEAYAKARVTTLSKSYSQPGGIAVRLYSTGPAIAEPSESDVVRLKAWIEREKPSLSLLKATAPDQIR